MNWVRLLCSMGLVWFSRLGFGGLAFAQVNPYTMREVSRAAEAIRSESTEPASQTGDMSKSGVGEMLIHPKMATVSSLVEQLESHSPSNGSRQKELLSCIKWHLFGLIVSPCFSHEDCHTIHKTGGGEATSHHIFNGGSCYIAPFYWLQGS